MTSVLYTVETWMEMKFTFSENSMKTQTQMNTVTHNGTTSTVIFNTIKQVN